MSVVRPSPTGATAATIECAARTGELPALMAFVESACARAALPEEIAFAVRLAAEEACTNVIRHAYRGRPEPGRVTVAVVREPDRIVLTIEDRGVPFAPGDAPAAPLALSAEERPLGGLGWHLIRQVMDEVHHAYDPTTGNRLTLVKRVPPPHIGERR